MEENKLLIKEITVHTARTIMSSEFEAVIILGKPNYIGAMQNNVFNKRTASGIKKTTSALTKLYKFDKSNFKFRILEDYCAKYEDLITQFAFLYSLSVDYLLQESIDYVKTFEYDIKVPTEGFEKNIQHHHSNRFSPKTLRSVAQNIASSWKQANYIQGKVKNIRKQSKPTHITSSFAFAMAYIDDLRGEYMYNHPSVKALDASTSELLSLIKMASDIDLLNYNQAGGTMVISFENYLKKFADVED